MLEQFDFHLPSELIAQQPAHPRDFAKLLVYTRKTKKITDDYFYNLNNYLPENSTLVLNNSKVEKCRLIFGKTEIFVLETINPRTIRALVRPGRKFTTDKVFNFGEIEVATIKIDQDGTRILKINRDINDKLIENYRHTPFPPYIAQNENLAKEYQTVFAKPLGSKAAPTAGLHFTSEMLNKLAKNHPIAEVTLHVGLGTFAPVTEAEVTSKKLHTETISIDERNAKILNESSSIIAVGTTSTRVLETIKKPFKSTVSATNIFIMPGYKFCTVDGLITNFHLPKSSLLLLVAAFLDSTEELSRIYNHAIEHKYRFYSFGDAMLII